MRKVARVLLLATMATLFFAASASAVNIVGKWKVTKMVKDGKTVPMPSGASIVMQFAAGDWTVTTVVRDKTRVDKGTYTLKGAELTTVDGRTQKKETSTVSIKDKVIVFRYAADKIVVVAKRG